MRSTVQVAATIHKRWSHVLIDEGQDTNLCQFELVRQITGPRSKLFMVGDPDQVGGERPSRCRKCSFIHDPQHLQLSYRRLLS
jgi:hypothetical protein